MSKPNWDDAPEWAQYLTLESDGEWSWWEVIPLYSEGGWWRQGSKCQIAQGISNDGVSFLPTMEKRP